jgi:hypothetical protein
MILPELADPRACPVRHKPELGEDDLWLTPGPAVWQAERFVGAPFFYPVYRWQNLYATTPLPLIVRKGALELDADVARRVRRTVRYLPTNATIDRHVRRVGSPAMSTLELSDPREYIAAWTDALRRDIAFTERTLPGHTNLVLCGGRDSLNLLLLPWQGPVVAVSAPPNFPLVQQFVRDNKLSIDVVPLADDDASLLDSEIALNSCRIGLEHARWFAELRALAATYDRRCTFWVGAMADVYTTAKWQRYSHPSWLSTWRGWPGLRALGRHEAGQSYFAWTCYYRGAMWQGVYMSLLRELTDAVVLSAYHGPAMRALMLRVDLRGAAPSDIRPAIGEALAGGPVAYPTQNPSPPASAFRHGVSHLGKFLEVLARHGVRAA